MKNKAIIFDIDGTAIDSPAQKVPTERLVKAIRDIEENYFVCAATGRPWSFAQPVLQGLSLVDPCIISGGTQICEPITGKILWQSNIDESDIATIFSIAKDYPDLCVLINDFDEKAYADGGIRAINLKTDEPVFFIDFIFVPQAIAPQIADKMSKIETATVTLAVSHRPGFNDIHITNKNATKEHAITELLSMINVEREDTIGIGDGQNDVHLFNAVGHKVAMSNAVDELKAASDEIIGSVVDDGMAEYLERLSDSKNKSLS